MMKSKVMGLALLPVVLGVFLTLSAVSYTHLILRALEQIVLRIGIGRR